jgi:NAD(P)-dependent dehydrogenase (short-subunit alcohol dehydrogenase family)
LKNKVKKENAFMALQQRLDESLFSYRSTAAEVVKGIDLTGKTAVVTGGYSGIGTETVRALTGVGAQVIVGARRPEVAQANLTGIADVTILPLELGDSASIDTFSAVVSSRISQLDILINNAAVMAIPLTRDERGYESQFAVNHLGHFQLTARLWPLLTAAKSARIVVLTSVAHSGNGLDIHDLNFEHRPYEKWTAYSQAKSANALFALSLDKLGEPHGVRAFAVHPGAIDTPLQRHMPDEEKIAMGWMDKEGNLNPLLKTVEQGAATTLWCATSTLLSGMGGVYCEDCNIAEPWKADNPPMTGVYPHVRNEVLADALWAKSEDLLGEKFPI